MRKINLNEIESKIPDFILKHFHLVAVLIIFFIIAVLDIYYVAKDTLPPSWDQSLHMQLSLIYFNLIKNGMLSEIVGVSGYYPPFFHISATPIYAIFGTSEDISRLSNLLFLLILLFSTYGIGKILFDKNTGLLATALIAMYPSLIIIQRDYLIDYALTSVIALSIYLLLKSERFTKFNYSIAFGFTLAAAELMKWPAAFFLIGPLLYIFYQKNNDKKCAYCGNKETILRNGLRFFCSSKHQQKYFKNKKNSPYNPEILNIVITAFITVIVAGIWYIPHFSEVYQSLMQQQTVNAVLEGEPEVWTLSSFSLYIETIFNMQLLLFFGIVFIIGVFFLYSKKGYTDQKIFFALSIVIPYLIFTLTRNKNTRYTLPLVVFFALISAFWLMNIQTKRKIKTMIIASVLIIGSLQVSTLYFGTPDFGSSPGGWIYPHVEKPKIEDWKVEEVLDAITESLPSIQNQRVVVIIMPDHHFVNGRTYSYYSYKKGIPLEIYNGAYLPFEVFRQNIDNIPYLIYKTNTDIDMAGSMYEGPVKNMYSLFEENKDKYQKLDESFPLPDGSTIYIYRNKMLG